MFRRAVFPAAGVLLAALLTPGPAQAQFVFESVGIRALGMAGAFVAVADDASAAYWNPAGLVNGTPLGTTIEWNRFQTGNQKAPPVPGPTLRNSTFASVASWPLGISYGRLRSTWLATGPGGVVTSEKVETFQLGGTIVQTIAPGVVLGSTLKYLRGSFATGPSGGPTVEDALDQGMDLDGPGQNHFDFDIGLMADFKMVRLGLTGRNLLEPQFTSAAGTSIKLQRLTRAGLAFLPTAGLTLAMDVDLDTVDLRDGLRRMIAVGGEGRLGSRVAVRGGVRWDTKGESQPVTALGVSVSLRSRFWLEGYYSRGQRDEDHGFGIGFRAG
ncbi:MAG TPA: conjugal transfer protein TraF [Vicinamibacterales bacterium]|nr:conjugal transfer protein TraF [Vicinamibacterales bacterium]